MPLMLAKKGTAYTLKWVLPCLAKSFNFASRNPHGMKPTKYILPLLLAGVVPCAGAPLSLAAGADSSPAPAGTVTDSTVVSSSRRLNEATVTAHAEATRLKYAPQALTLLSTRQIDGSASSLNEVLGRVAGVTIRSMGGVGSSSRISVRGLEGKRMGLYIDGTSAGQISNFVTLDDIPTDMIERVEVYKGIVPYRFGGTAMGGAVNVVLKDYPPRYLDASYEVGSYNTHRANSVFKRSFADLGLELGLGGLFVASDNDYEMTLHNQNDLRVRRGNDAFRKAVLGGSIKETKWWFDELKSEFVLTSTRQGIQGIDWDYRSAHNHASSFLVSLEAKRKNFFVEGLDFDFATAYNIGGYGLCDTARVRHAWDGRTYPTLSPLGGETGPFASDGHHRSHDWIGKLNLEYTIRPDHALNLNLYGTGTWQQPHNELMDRSLGYPANFDSRLTALTTGLSYEAFFFDRRLQTAVTAKHFLIGSRAQMLHNFYLRDIKTIHINRSEWGGNLAACYRITPLWTVKGSVASEVRIPTSEELLGNSFNILPSPDLLPERNKSLNLGLLYRRPLSDDRVWEAEINAYMSELTDMVRFTPDLLPTMARYTNFGQVRTMGIEAEIKADVTRWCYLYANGTWQDLRDRRRTFPNSKAPNPTYGLRIPNIPYLMANFGGELHWADLFGHGQNTRLLLDASYVHRYSYDFEMGAYLEKLIPTSLTFDAAIEQRFAHRRWTLTLKVKNLTDRETVSEFNRPLPGRTCSVKLRYLLH